MRHRSDFLSLVQHWLSSLLRFPDPQAQFGVLTRNGLRKFAQHLLINRGPKLQKRHRGVEAHIQRSVVGIVKALEESKRWRHGGVGMQRTPPKRAAIGKDVKLIEEHPAVPSRLAFVINIRRLPAINGIAPFGGMQQPVASDGPRVAAVGSVEICVTPIPFAALSKLDYRKIPSD